MKKLALLVVILVMAFASPSVAGRNKELYKALVSFTEKNKSSNTAMVEGTRNLPEYEIDMGHVVYLPDLKTFAGEYKYYNFYISKKTSTFSWMGVNAEATKEERKALEIEILKWLKTK